MRYEIVFEGEIRSSDLTPVPPAEIEEWVHRITVELMNLGAGTPSIGASTGDGTVTIRVMVDNPDADLAHGIGASQIRAACHAAGLATPGWKVHWVRIYVDPGSEVLVPDDASALATTNA